VAFSVDKRYTLYSSTRALIRYDNLVGDRFLEITSGPGELRKLSPGGTIDQRHTKPALDLDALLGGLRPVLKGLDADKVNTISSYVIDLLQGQGGALSNLLANTNSFGSTLGAHDRAIGDVITNLNAVLATVDAKGAQFSDTVDQLQKLITGLAEGRDAIAGAIPPLATTTSDLTDLLKHSRRPLQGTLENLRPLAGELNDRLPELNNDIEQLGEDYLRLSALGAYGAYFNIYFCSVSLKINGPSEPGSSEWSSWCASSWSHSATPSCRSGRKAGPTPPISPTQAGSTQATTSTSPGSKLAGCKRSRSPATPPRSPSPWIVT
jgi:phospholipid/cholesterol/gamma-HCH transport system substrate-binding protein